LALTAVGYRGVLANQFVLDDTHTVARNPAVQSLAHAREWFTSAHAVSGVREYVNYRPVLIASYAMDHAAWGGLPAGFHATNLVIHVGVIILVWALARRLAPDPWAAAGAAALFALHPINAEAVNYVTARSSSLMTLWALAALWAHERTGPGASTVSRPLPYLLGAAALGTKEAAVVLPLLVVAWRRAAHGRDEAWIDTARRSAPWWGLVAAYWALRTWILWGLVEPAVGGAGATVAQNALFALKIYAASLGFWLWPQGLAVDHAWPMTLTLFDGVLIVAAVLALLAATATAFRWDSAIGWCLAWFWIGILPAGALGFMTRLALYQDNRGYLAGVGLAWAGGLLAAGVRRLGMRPAARTVAAIGVAALVGVAVKADAARTAAWTNRAALWEDVVAKYPSSLMAHNGLGMVAFESGRVEEAREWYQRAIRLSPGFTEGHKNLGVTFAAVGEWDQAIAAFERALAIDPGYAEARVNLGKVYERQGRWELALAAYDRILHDDPGNASVLARTAWLLGAVGRLPDAADRYARLRASGQADGDALAAYGAVLVRLERWDEGERVLSELLDRVPDSYAAQFNLAAALEGRGAWDRAAEEYRRAAALNLADPDPLYRIGVLLSKQEQWPRAAAAYDEALRRDPRHTAAHLNAGMVAERTGDVPQALRHYDSVIATAGDRPGDEELRERAREAAARLRRGRLAGGAERPVVARGAGSPDGTK
jgi:tetratricopeptide (TPR) repeat protein